MDDIWLVKTNHSRAAGPPGRTAGLFLAACGIEMIPVSNRHADPVGYMRRVGASAVILTGGNNISPSMGTRDDQAPRVPEMQSDLAPERDVTEGP